MTGNDRDIQDALERGAARAPGGGAEWDAYAAVFGALGEEDPAFALPADFAEAMTARVMPVPARASVFERYVLPVMMLVCTAVAVPVAGPPLLTALWEMLGSPASTGELPTAAIAAAALVLVAAADRLAARRGWVPSPGAHPGSGLHPLA